MSQPKKPFVIDLFCGAGGLSLGFKQAGFKILAGFDSDPINIATHTKNFPGSVSTQADIRELTGEVIRWFAGLHESSEIHTVIGGPPCQGFSMIGRRDMRDGRNLLLNEFCRLVAELSPRYFVMENVAGLMYGEARKFLADGLRLLKKQGYRWVTPIRVLNASDFGVPQRRRRAFVLGYKRGESKPNYPRPMNRRPTVKDAIGDLKTLGRKKSLFRTDIHNGALGEASSYAKALRKGSRGGRLTGCLRAMHTRNVVKRFRATKPGTTEPISRFTRLRHDKPSPTLRAGTPKEYGSYTAARPIHPTQARCITVREAARIHSFPDWFEFHATQWHGFRQIGNSVPPLLAKGIATQIRKIGLRATNGTKRRNRSS